jgi:hypothetical protein
LTSTTETPRSDSPETQAFIDGCLALAQGNTDGHEALLSASAARLEELNQTVDDLFAEMDAEGPEFYQKFRHHFEGIEAAFQSYSESLEQILLSAENEGIDFHQIACDLATASRQISIGMAQYQEDYLSQGPSQFPIVNLFDNVARGIRESGAPAAGWEQICSRYIGFYSGAVAEIDNSQHQDKPGIAQRRKALNDILACLNELLEFDHSNPVSKLESILARFSAAHVDLEAAFDTYHQAEFSDGPTKGAKLNWIIKAAEGVLAGTYTPEILGGLAQDVLAVTQENLVDMKQLSQQKLESVTLNEELSKMIEATEGVEDALAFLVDFADDPQIPEEQVREAIQELIESGDLLVQATELVQQYNETAGKVTCVQCQAQQEPGSRVCEACGAQLPGLPGTGAYSTGDSSVDVREGKPEDAIDQEEVMTDVMKALFEACEEFLEGEKPVDDLEAHVMRNLSNIDDAEEALSALAVPAMPEEANPEERELSQGFIDLTEDALATLEQGVAECRLGLTQISEGARAQDQETMQEGMAIYYQGTQKMWQVKRLDHELTSYIEADDKLPDGIAEESVQLGED